MRVSDNLVIYSHLLETENIESFAISRFPNLFRSI